MATRDTIFALSSGRPPAAIAVVRISGPKAHEAAEALCVRLPKAREAGVRTLRDPDGKEILDEALVLRFDGPASSTGEDAVELHCHGGRAVIDGVLAALSRVAGLREAVPGEFTRRAFENGRIDLTEAEGLADLIEAETEAQRRAALRIAEGGLRRQIEQWRARVLDLSAQAELAIDYVGEDDAGYPTVAADARMLASELDEWLSRPRAERLRDGIRVVAAGPPNAGKSSLINAIVGTQKIIVSDIPGTTRDVIEVPIALDGRPFVFVDTAGMRDSSDDIEALGIGLAKREVEQADIVLWLGSAGEAPDHPCLVLVQPKADLGAPPKGGAISVSAKTGSGIRDLLERIVALGTSLIPGEDAIAINRRQAEAIADARTALYAAGEEEDLVVQTEELRVARLAFDRLTGRAGVEDLLDALFARFCLGK